MTDTRPSTPAPGEPVIVTLPAELDIASAVPPVNSSPQP